MGEPDDRAELVWARGPRDLEEAIALRREVFCEEQGVPLEEELDGRDADAEHLVGLAPGGERVLGTLRLLIEGDTAKIGRVAVRRGWRGRGIAGAMLQEALGAAAGRGCRRARLASQLDVVGLYERAGFSVRSEVFEDAGIPHVWMDMELSAGG